MCPWCAQPLASCTETFNRVHKTDAPLQNTAKKNYALTCQSAPVVVEQKCWPCINTAFESPCTTHNSFVASRKATRHGGHLASAPLHRLPPISSGACDPSRPFKQYLRSLGKHEKLLVAGCSRQPERRLVIRWHLVATSRSFSVFRVCVF